MSGVATASIASVVIERQVDRDDQDGRRPAGDHVGPCLAQAVIEPVRALEQGPCTDRRCVPQDLAIRADHQHVPEAGHVQGGHHGPCQEPLDQIPPFLGVEHLAEPASWRPRACRPG